MVRRLACLASLILLASCPGSAPAPACRSVTFSDTPFTVCSFDPAVSTIRLFHTAPDGEVYGQFDRLAQHSPLLFAMNGGMYHEDRRPVGLYVERGATLAPIVLAESNGNFGMLPNGVFWLRADGTAGVTETSAFAAPETPGVWYATQSGPMLVIDGALHPKFNVDGKSRKRRNGVGIDEAGHVHFAISNVPVNFHTFARLFRDELATPNALFLDGQVSKIYSAELELSEKGLDMGPIIAVTIEESDQ